MTLMLLSEYIRDPAYIATLRQLLVLATHDVPCSAEVPRGGLGTVCP